MSYDHKTIDKKWQQKWDKLELYKTPENPDLHKKSYILDMFPYPSGAGLHVGHPIGYIATDILSRYARMNGRDVLHPMGWDAFGLPAENYAIKQGVHPDETTKKNIIRFREQIKSLGLSYDWSREVNTSQPDYYKWTQWLFLQLYKNEFAYKKTAYVNWCPKDNTVLANEQVINGKCDRCGTVVIQKNLEQWFFAITKFADRLLNDLEGLDWPDNIKAMQRYWIGRSEGALIKFPIYNSDKTIEVFTTRPDTLFGATYMVLAPDHSLVQEFTTPDRQAEVSAYIQETATKSELERTALEKDKTGVFTGAYAVNPATEENIPIWIADYVLSNYGTGAIMAVPAHDERDLAFAKKFNLIVRRVVAAPKGAEEVECYTEEGTLVNSGEYNYMTSAEARQHITADFGKAKIQYKLRDWLVSRQRYWGAPIPIIYCEQCGMQPMPEDQLPVQLPMDVDFLPTGESPLARSAEFHKINCPKCNGPAKRDSDTMDTFVDSSWYFLRFTDPHNNFEFASKEKMKSWMAVDHYQGGAEHAVLHLLYARFITKVLYDLRLVDFDEPFKKLRNQGLILGPDGDKMSKSKGNVVNPDDVVAEFGADSFRMYEMFMGPLEDAKPWNTQGILGVRRFLDRVYGIKIDASAMPVVAMHKLIKKISDDVAASKFNTAISTFMEFLNKNSVLNQTDWETFLKLLAPFAPHLTEEVWQGLGYKDSIHKQAWPQHDNSKLVEEMAIIAIQIMGKLRSTIQIKTGSSQEEVKQLALSDSNVQTHLANKEVIKEIFIPNKLINFVIR